MKYATIISILLALPAAPAAIAAPAANVGALTQRSPILNGRADSYTTMPYRAAYANDWFSKDTTYFPSAKDLGSINSIILSFYNSTGPTEQAQHWMDKTQEEREAILKDYHDNDKKIIVAAYGGADQDEVKADYNADPTPFAEALVKYVKDYSLDGVDFDYELHNLHFDKGIYDANDPVHWKESQTCAAFLKKMHFAVREGLGKDYIVSHTPMSHWHATYRPYDILAKDTEFAADVSYIGLQYYNMGQLYTTCDQMLVDSSNEDTDQGKTWSGSAMDEIVAKGIDRSKLVLVKSLDGSKNMEAADLNKCIAEWQAAGKSPGGFAVWQYYHPDQTDNGNEFFASVVDGLA